jgi:hypothetical protein
MRRYEVVRTLGGAGYTDVALVLTRSADKPHRFARHRPQEDTTLVLHHEVFRPLSELAELESYAAQLERAAAHAEAGAFWYFVTTKAHRDGTVEVSLFDRWFDGRKLRCEERAHREFSSRDESVETAAVDFTAGLQAWAEHRNEEREAACREAAGHEDVEDTQAAQSAAGALELSALLASVTK